MGLVDFSDDSGSLTTRQRWTLTGLISAGVALGALDVISDLAEGATVSHVAVEVGGIVCGIVAIAWIWIQNRKLEARALSLTGRLAEATAEASTWRESAKVHLQGLGQAIDRQFEAWSLSSAEKEVAMLLLKGLSLKEIGVVRNTAERTTRQQAQDVYRKSGLAGRAEFSAFFLEELLLPNKVQ